MNPTARLAASADERFPEGLALHREGGVLSLAIDRPDDLNRLSPEVLVRLGNVAESLREDADTIRFRLFHRGRFMHFQGRVAGSEMLGDVRSQNVFERWTGRLVATAR